MFAKNFKIGMNKSALLIIIFLVSLEGRAQKKWFRVDDPAGRTCYFIDTIGRQSAIGTHDKNRIAEHFSEGLICVNFKKNSQEKDAWGCLNDRGDTVIKGKYLEPFRFYNGIAKVSTSLISELSNSDDDESVYNCQYINTKGLPIHDMIFEEKNSSIMDHSWAIVKSKKQWYILSKHGKLKELSVDFEQVYPFSNGLALCKRMNTYTVYIDTTGWPVVEIPNEHYTGDYSNGYATYSTVKDKYGFMNKNGHPISPCIYEAILNFSEGLAAVKIYNKWGFIDNKGKIIIAVKYDRVDQFADGLARVKLDDKFGFIDKNGKVIIPIKLSDSHNFVKGLASACDDRNLWGLLSKNGQWVIKPQFMTMENINGTEFTSVLYSDKPQTKKGKTEAFKKALISPNGKILWCSGNPPQIK